MSDANASALANSSEIAYFTYSPICGGGNDFDGRLGLHIAAVFVILVTSLFGALFPMSAKKLPMLHIPDICFAFAKFFGSGVIIATAFIHLLASSFQELGDPCLSTFWYVNYPWSAAFSMIAVFSLFLVELFAMRFAHMSFATTDALGRSDSVETILPESNPRTDPTAAILPDHFSADANQANETKHEHEAKLGHESPAAPMASVAPAQRLDARLLGFFVLEFGVIFHSVIIGLTLSTTGADFITLFVVIIFHQMFEGLGLGSRLAILPFKKRSIWPWVLGIIYGFVTPLGMAIGLGLRTTYDSSSQTALIVSGTLDAISSGILLYTGLVELLAHEFLFSREVREGPMWKLLFCLACLIAGTALMGLLGKWA